MSYFAFFGAVSPERRSTPFYPRKQLPDQAQIRFVVLYQAPHLTLVRFRTTNATNVDEIPSLAV